jgi:hypothetical protein
MPADRLVELPIGSNGLDLRSSVTELEPGDLADTLNWQIDRTGALLKRRGFSGWSVAAPANILKLLALNLSGGTIWIVAHCADGHVYATVDGSSWASIDSGLSTTTPVGGVQYLDTLYYCDGANAMRSWDGTTLTALPAADVNDVQTVTITGTPSSGTFKLHYGGADTVDLAYNAAASDVQTALQGLTPIGPGNVLCTGGALPGTGVVCTFVGALAARPITLMTSTDALGGGTAPASHVTHTTTGAAKVPEGTLLTVWRNRLFVSGVAGTPRRVFWSVINAPASFINKNNYVDFPTDSPITAIVVGPNVGLGAAGADGVLVFTQNALHRIYDDADNVAGIITGGANLLVDAAAGVPGPNMIAPTIEGNLWFLSESGFLSTDGHAVSQESTRVQPLLQTFAWNLSSQFCAFGLNGRYYLSFTPVGEGANTRVLEAYADLFRIGWIRRRGGQHQWMAHDLPIASAVVVDTSLGQVCYFADSSPNDGAFVRRLFDGAADTDGNGTPVAITATARTGAQLFGMTTPKRLRRAELYGYGNVSLSVSADLATGVGETLPFDMRTTTRVWSLSDKWGVGVWGGGGGAKRKAGYFTTRGRYLAFTITESSQDAAITDRVLGYAGTAIGGAAVYSVILKLTPIDAD